MRQQQQRRGEARGPCCPERLASAHDSSRRLQRLRGVAGSQVQRRSHRSGRLIVQVGAVIEEVSETSAEGSSSPSPFSFSRPPPLHDAIISGVNRLREKQESFKENSRAVSDGKGASAHQARGR